MKVCIQKRLLLSSILTLTLSATIFGCNVKVEDTGPEPFAGNEKQLVVSSYSDTQSGNVNEIFMESPSSTVTYFFDYSPTMDQSIHFGSHSWAGFNCDTTNMKTKAIWVESINGVRVNEFNLIWGNDNVTVYSGRSYRLELTFSQLGVCNSLSYSFPAYLNESFVE